MPEEEGERSADIEPDAPPPAPTAFRVTVASVLAGATTELATGLVLLALSHLAYGELLPAPLWGWLLAAGVLGGGVYAVAELAARRRAWLGILVALPLLPAVLFGARFALEASLSGNPLEGMAAVIKGFSTERLEGIALFCSGALFIYGPLLLVRRRGLGVVTQVYAMCAGTLLWLVGLLALPVAFEALNLSTYLLPLAVRIVVFPLGLVGGDRAASALLRLAGQGELSPRAAGATKRGARTPAQRHKAKHLCERAKDLLAAGPADAARTYAEAYGLWPSGERALLAAKAWSRADEPYEAIAWLEKMLGEARPGPAALDDPELSPLHGLEAFEALRSRVPAVEARRTPRGGLDPRWTLHSLAGCVGAVLLALALKPARRPEVPADVTRQALRSLLRSDPSAEFATARLLERGAAGTPSESVWLPHAMLRAGVPAVSAQDYDAAALWYRRAATGGHVEAMVHVAENYALHGKAEEAAAWHRRAAEAGEAFSMFKLAQAYRWGDGVERDLPLALDWYRRGAEAGSAHAMFTLSGWLEIGRDIPQDLDEAIHWMERAAAAGHPPAQAQLVRLRRLRHSRGEADRVR